MEVFIHMHNNTTNAALIERFNHIMSWAKPITAVRINTGTKLEELSHIISRTMETLESIMKNESTEFMAAPVLDFFFTQMRPAINIPVDELIAGNTEKLDEVNSFVNDLANHPVRQMWAEKAEIFCKIAESAGYKFEHGDYKDLAIIAPIVANAITTFDDSKYYRYIFKVREGNRSGNAPVMLDEIHLFHDIADAVHIYENISVPAFIGFFGIEKTYGMNNNKFDDWRYGRNARKNSFMKNGVTEREYNAMIDTYSRKVYCIVRDGENIWIFQPPITMSHGECLGDNGTFTNWYGQRSTYAPIQIFWTAFAPQADVSNALVPYKPRKWSMREILDEDQKVWLPIFFSTTKNYFFTNEEPIAEKARMCNETNVMLQLPDTTTSTNLPATCHSTITLPDMDELFSRDTLVDEDGRPEAFIGINERTMYAGALKMLKWMGITSVDIADAPISFDELEFEKDVEKHLAEQTVAAYYKIIRDKLPDFWQKHAEITHKWFCDWMDKNHAQVVEDIKSGRIKAEIHVHHRPFFDESGNPEMIKKHSQSGEMIPHLDTTDIDIGKRLGSGRTPHLTPYQWFSSPSLVDKRPPATVSIYCETPEDVANLMRSNIEELPMAVQLMNVAYAFDNRHGRLNMTAHLIYNKSDFKKTFPNM